MADDEAVSEGPPAQTTDNRWPWVATAVVLALGAFPGTGELAWECG